MIDEKEDFNGSYNHEFDVKFAIDNKETKVTFKAETPEEKRSWMAVLGSDFVFLIFSQFSQIFSRKRNWHKNAKIQKLGMQTFNVCVIKLTKNANFDKLFKCIRGRSQTTFTRQGR